MYHNGHLDIAGQVKNLKFEQLASDPASPALSQAWFNSVDLALKYYDGVSVQILATGSGALAEYLKLDGSSAMTGVLTLSSNDQTGEADTAATSKGYVDAGLNTKQNTITGAASTVVTDNLDNSKAIVSDGSGKIISATSTTAAEIEYLAGVTGAIQTQIDGKQDDLGYVPVNKAGDSMSGTLAMNNNEITGVGAPLAANSAARLIDVQNAVAGMDFQADVVGYESDFAGTPGRYIYIDGSEFATGLTAAAGDIVVVDAAGEITAVSYDVSTAGNGALAWNETSTVWLSYADGAWGEFGGLAGVTAGVGLSKSGNVINVNLGAGIAELPTDEVGIDVLPSGGLFTTEDGSTSSTATGAQLSVKLDGDALALSVDGLTIAPSGVDVTMLDATAFGDGLQGGSGTTVSVQAVTDGGILVGVGGVEVDDTEMRTRVLYRDGAEAMTGPLILSSNDQTAAAGTAAVSKDYMVAQINALAGDAVTELATRLEGGFFLYEELVTAGTTHTVTHNMGTQFVQVIVIDSTNAVVIPESITFTSANALVVTFYTAQTCRILVTGLKAAV